MGIVHIITNCHEIKIIILVILIENKYIMNITNTKHLKKIVFILSYDYCKYTKHFIIKIFILKYADYKHEKVLPNIRIS